MFFFIKAITYFTIGSAIGLISWIISLPHYRGSEISWMLWLMIPFSALLSGVISITDAMLDSDRKFSTFVQQFQWFFIGAVFGGIGGLTGVFLSRGVFYALTEHGRSILFARICGMFILGFFIGIAAGLAERIRMGSWERCFSIMLAGALGGVFGGFLRHELTLISGSVDFLGITVIIFGGVLVLALILVTRLRTAAILTGHPDNMGVKYGEGFEYPLPSDADLWIGSGMRERSSPKTRLKIYADAKVDKIQAAIGFKDDGWYLIQAPDFPRYGEHTYINGKQIKGRTRLRDGDVLTLGKTKFVFRIAVDDSTKAASMRRYQNGRKLALLICTMVAAWVLGKTPVRATGEFIIVPEGDMSTEQYPLLSVPFRMLDTRTQADIWVDISGGIDPRQWHVKDVNGRSLGQVISVEPLDAEHQEDRLYIILAMDISKSMDYPREHPRLEQAMEVATRFVTKLRKNCYVALLPFAALVPNIDTIQFYGPDQREYLLERIKRLKHYAGERNCTALYPALSRSLRALSAMKEKNLEKAVILLTDGYQDLDDVGRTYNCKQYKQFYSSDELSESALTTLARNSRIPIYAFGFDLPELDEKEQFLRNLTVISGKKGETRFFKNSGANLNDVYDKLDTVTRARRFKLTFRTSLPPNEFIDPPDYFIYFKKISSKPARVQVAFFALPRGERKTEIKTWILTIGIACVTIFILIVAQALLRIQMLARQKRKEEEPLPLRQIRGTSRKPQHGYTAQPGREGRIVVPPETVKNQKIHANKDISPAESGKTNGQTDGLEVSEKMPSQMREPAPVDRYEDVPKPPPPPAREIPDLEDVPDWMKELDE